MAAYAAAVTSLLRKSLKVDQNLGLFMWAGQCDVTNYNTTLAEITGITGKFRASGIVAVTVSGVSDNGHVFRWDSAGLAFKVYHGDYSNASDGPLVEAAVDTDVGAIDFIAVGLR